MGSDFVSIDEAAKLLGRSRRSVTEYLKNGVLRRVRQGKKVMIPRQEVEDLCVDIGANLPPMNRQTFFQLTSRIQRIEAAMAVLKKAAGFSDAPIRPDKNEAVGMLAAAKKAKEESSWKLDEIDLWADMYEKMDEVFFDAVSAFTSESEAWRPFYKLCAAQAHQLAYSPDFKTSLRVQALHDRLCFSLKNMRHIILAWIEAGNGSAPDIAMPEEALLRLIPAKVAASQG